MGILIKNVSKVIGDTATLVLNGIDLEIPEGDFVALTGRSGSGKSTLLYVVSTLDTPTGGSVEIDGIDVASLGAPELHQLRNERIGFVFQFHYLLPELTAIENVLMPARKRGLVSQRRGLAEALLREIGLGEKLNRLPRQLSGGEQQRVAIARALLLEPKYLFADEPTGNLDSVNSENVMGIFKRVNAEKGTTIVMVTHDPGLATQTRSQVQLSDGKVVSRSTQGGGRIQS